MCVCVFKIFKYLSSYIRHESKISLKSKNDQCIWNDWCIQNRRLKICMLCKICKYSSSYIGHERVLWNGNACSRSMMSKEALAGAGMKGFGLWEGEWNHSETLFTLSHQPMYPIPLWYHWKVIILIFDTWIFGLWYVCIQPSSTLVVLCAFLSPLS